MIFSEYEVKALNEVFDRISNSAPQRLDLDVLIGKYGVISARTFTRAYKELFGKSPLQHQQETMMLYAKQRMREGEQVKVIAFELGYNDVANFSKRFKKVIGYAPSRIKRT